MVCNDTSVEHRTSTPFVSDKYLKLDGAVITAGVGEPEKLHLDSPFSGNRASMQRYRFFEDLQLSVPIDLFKFCPGGSSTTAVCIVQLEKDRIDNDMTTAAARLTTRPDFKAKFREFHTRDQRKMFKEGLSNCASVLPAVSDFIYKDLALDASQSSHPATHDRIEMIFLGADDLIPDLHHLNPGPPGSGFDPYFKVMGEIVEEATTADERRQNIAHLSRWISVRDLMSETEKRLKEPCPIPSESLIRLQFAPKNPYTKRVLAFTSAINMQYKIQRRQLRAEHVDQHYVAAQFKILKEWAVEQKSTCRLYFSDDKAKVSVGEPRFAVSTGVRGRTSLAPIQTTLVPADYDIKKASLTPSVYLRCAIPDTIQETFLRGKVFTLVNDSVFQESSPFRHAAALVRLEKESPPSLLAKFTDGGVDQRNTLESVKCASICIFKELNLDMLITARCAPGQSWTNPAERIMSILNIGLQNCSLERESMDKESEDAIKNCNSMASIREKAKAKPELKRTWKKSIQSVQQVVSERFGQLALKDEPVTVLEPFPELEIDVLQRHLRELFLGMDLDKL